MTNSAKHPRILIFRLSSMGDLILCSSSISALARCQPSAQVDWVIGSKFASLLSGDSRLHRVVPFDRAQGFLQWHSMCRRLFSENYDEVLDLHSSLRTSYARLYFQIRRLISGRGLMPWRRLSKSRIRRLGFFIFKSFWPQRLRPSAQGGLAVRAAVLAGGDAQDRPNLGHFHQGSPSQRVTDLLTTFRENPSGYIAVMPGSAWPGKCWPVSHWARALQIAGSPVVVLGSRDDAECFELEEALNQLKLPFVSAFRDLSLQETAQVIVGSRLVVSNDTGLVHLAEALGKSVVVIFGPTHPDLGFGPWRSTSRSVSSSLWCRPCSKDGTACFRKGDKRYLCMSRLVPERVAQEIRQALAVENKPRGQDHAHFS